MTLEGSPQEFGELEYYPSQRAGQYRLRSRRAVVTVECGILLADEDGQVSVEGVVDFTVVEEYVVGLPTDYHGVECEYVRSRHCNRLGFLLFVCGDECPTLLSARSLAQGGGGKLGHLCQRHVVLAVPRLAGRVFASLRSVDDNAWDERNPEGAVVSKVGGRLQREER